MKKCEQTHVLVKEALRMSSASLEAKRNLYSLIVQNRVDFPTMIHYSEHTQWQEELKSCQGWLKTKNKLYSYWNY